MAPKRYAAATRMGRLAKAKQFQLAANTISTIMDDQVIADAYVTLCVQAGIAAADVICCAKLGEHHQGENHNEAIALVAKSRQDGRQEPQRVARPEDQVELQPGSDVRGRSEACRSRGSRSRERRAVGLTRSHAAAAASRYAYEAASDVRVATIAARTTTPVTSSGSLVRGSGRSARSAASLFRQRR